MVEPGWDKIREERRQRLPGSGLLPAGTQLRFGATHAIRTGRQILEPGAWIFECINCCNSLNDCFALFAMTEV